MSTGPLRPRHTLPLTLFASYERAFGNMPRRERLRPDQLTDRAKHILVDRFGLAESPVYSGFSHVGFGLFAHHTCFVEGEAALLTLSQGTAVAVRSGSKGVLAVASEAASDVFRLGPGEDPHDAPLWVRLAVAMWNEQGASVDGVEVALVTTAPQAFEEPYAASLAIALYRAYGALRGYDPTTPLPFAALSHRIAGLIQAPYSAAYLMAADSGAIDAIVMANTLTNERRIIPIPGGDAVCWGVVDVGAGIANENGAHLEFAARAGEALQILKKGPYRDLRSLTLLPFKEIHRALNELPASLRPVVRFLVGETHRSHHLDTALKRSDWHVVGGLLFFSHAALRQEWAATYAEVDFVVETVEAQGDEGMYGACLSGRRGSVLVVGQRHAVPRCIERIREGYRERFGAEPVTMLL